MKRLLNRSPFVILLLAVILIGLLALLNLSAMQIVLAPLFLLFLPGYIITAVLFPRERLDIPERLALSIGLSVAAIISNSLIHHFTPWGIQVTQPWLVLLLYFLELGAVVFVINRFQGFNLSSGLSLSGFNLRQLTLGVLTVVVVVTALRVAKTPAPPHGLEGYTLLWVQPDITSEQKIHLGVRSEEFTTMAYRLEFEFNGITHQGPTLRLNPGEVWEKTLLLPWEQPPEGPLTVALYRLDNPTEVYRHVVWWSGTS